MNYFFPESGETTNKRIIKNIAKATNEVIFSWEKEIDGKIGKKINIASKIATIIIKIIIPIAANLFSEIFLKNWSCQTVNGTKTKTKTTKKTSKENVKNWDKGFERSIPTKIGEAATNNAAEKEIVAFIAMLSLFSPKIFDFLNNP